MDKPEVEKHPEVALAWIADILDSHDIPFQISGGLAARVYGSERELADIDIDLPDAYLPLLADLLADHVVWGPARYLDREWDLMLLTVNYAGCDIDLGGASGAEVYDRAAHSWVPSGSRLETAVRLKVLGVEVPVITRDALIDYKSRIDRDVDRADVAAIRSSGDTSSQLPESHPKYHNPS